MLHPVAFQCSCGSSTETLARHELRSTAHGNSAKFSKGPGQAEVSSQPELQQVVLEGNIGALKSAGWAGRQIAAHHWHT